MTDHLKVIDGEGLDGKPPVVSKDRPGRRCLHRQMELDHTSRTVSCKDCEATLDAFECLAQLASHWERYAFAVHSARSEAKRLNERVAELKREERNAKARKRRREA